MHFTIKTPYNRIPSWKNLTSGSSLEKLLRVEVKNLKTPVPTGRKKAKISGETVFYEIRKETGYVLGDVRGEER